MAEVMLVHHAQGQTTGFHAFADELRRAGHTVRAPDLYDGRTFDSLDAELAYVPSAAALLRQRVLEFLATR